MRHSIVLALTLIPAAMAVASVAHADAPAVFIVSDRQASDRADELVNRALALGNVDHYSEAEPLLREAWGLKHSYDIAANLGIVETNLGKWRDAAEHMAFALKNFPTNGKPEHRKLGELMLAKALTHVAACTIKVNVERAEVLVDGRSVGLSPLPDVVFLEPGARNVEARRSGYATVTRAVTAEPGTTIETALVLHEAVPQRPPPWKPGAALIVPAGVLAVGGLAAGIGLTVAANSAYASAVGLRNQIAGVGATCTSPLSPTIASKCQGLQNDANSRDALSKGAVAGFVAGGVFALATVGLGWRAATVAKDSRTAAPSVRVLPVVSANAGGVFVVGEW